MNILIINGSPTGDDSITLQTMLYLQKLYSGPTYVQLNVGRRIRSYEKDFTAAREALLAADLIVFCYPVYTFLVPAQLHRFIELIKEHEIPLAGTFATQVSTSKHFYDVTAHEFVRQNCTDLGLRYIEGLSADMEDLLNKRGQREAQAFFAHVLWSMERGISDDRPTQEPQTPLVEASVPTEERSSTERGQAAIVCDVDDGPAQEPHSSPVGTSAPAEERGSTERGNVAIVRNTDDGPTREPQASPAGTSAPAEERSSTKLEREATTCDTDVNPAQEPHSSSVGTSAPAEERGSTARGKVAIVCDIAEADGPLARMVARFQARCPYPTQVVNLHDFAFAGGCLGCFHCASDGTCVYKDGFAELLREGIQTADATVYAFSIRDHSMGSRFKLFDDRQFCNGHRTVTMGKPVGYLVDGHLGVEPNLRQLIEARAQVGGNHLAGIATNEANPDDAIDALVEELTFAIQNNYQQPANFYGVGGLKIFRDLIYQMQGLMREDHRFYKSHGFYDFPQKRRGTIAGMYLVGALMRNKRLAKNVGANMTSGMLMPYQRVIDAVERR